MSKQHRIVRSEDATTIVIDGDRRRPEPAHAIVRFPGGVIEVARASDGTYWIHASRYVSPPDEDSPAGAIVESRIDYAYEEQPTGAPSALPSGVEHFALRIRRA